VVLKTSEGVAAVVFQMLREEITATPLGMLGALLLRSAFGRLKHKLDVSEVGGAPLVGVDGIAVLTHGAADAKAIKNGIRVAAGFAESGLPEAVAEAITKHAPLWSDEAQEASG
jgi:glycerol-3-phosphate acyltransferase PlsX